MFKRVALAFAVFVGLCSQAFALTPTQRLLLFSGSCPQQISVNGICPSFGVNFQTGTYWVHGQGYIPLTGWLSVVRASQKTDLRPDSAAGASYNIYDVNTVAINSTGFLPEESRITQLSNSNAPATQTTGSLATGVYTLWVNGTGSAQMSAGTATGCGTGTATNGTAVNFTITVAGTCTVTVTGALNAFQLELGSFGTSFIVCIAAPCTRAADVPTLIGPAATAALAAKSAFLQTFGLAGGTQPTGFVYDAGSVPRMTYGATNTVVSIDTANLATATLGSGTVAGVVKYAAGFDLTSFTAVANGGTKVTSANPWTISASSPVLIGNRTAGTRALNGYMQRFALDPSKGVFDGSTQLPYLLKRDVIPGTPANDNTPMFLYEAA